VFFICVDVEADGPTPLINSMIEIGAVVVHRPANKTMYEIGATFLGSMAPLPNHVSRNDALEAIGRSRAEIEGYPRASLTMEKFNSWVQHVTPEGVRRPSFVSDNAGFDWQFVNAYFHYYIGSNPFGFSSLSLTSFYKGLRADFKQSFKKYRITKHTHSAVDDAMGNAEALCTILNSYSIRGV
jgi:DNA polymerase III alpha subunit (gram-positive type)